MSEVLELACRLIARPSITPKDAGCMELICERLQPLGFQPEFLDFGETRNLWLKRGEGEPVFVFLGHTDVVPPGPLEAWRFPPFEPRVAEGKLYGRGAADMKGAVAAFTVAARRFVERCPGHRGTVALLLTSDEEGKALDGIRKVAELLKARGEKPTWCLVGEPSSEERLGDVIKVGRRGSLTGWLKISGIQGHVAYPEKARNPIHQFAPALKELVETEWDRGDRDFPPTSFQIANIHAGTGADNVIPGELVLQFNFRFSPSVTAEELKARVHEILDRYGLDYRLDWFLSGEPFLTRGGELLEAVQESLEALLGHRAVPSTGGGTSDGRFLAPLGSQVVELGLPNGTIHKVDEHVAVDDLERLALLYERILAKLLGGETAPSPPSSDGGEPLLTHGYRDPLRGGA